MSAEAQHLARARSALNESPTTRAELKAFGKQLRLHERTSFSDAMEFAEATIKVRAS